MSTNLTILRITRSNNSYISQTEHEAFRKMFDNVDISTVSFKKRTPYFEEIDDAVGPNVIALVILINPYHPWDYDLAAVLAARYIDKGTNIYEERLQGDIVVFKRYIISIAVSHTEEIKL